jgi:hypothetical protein
VRRPAREGSPSTPAQGSPGKVSAKNMQKQQYLQGFLQKTCKNSSIYKVFCNAHAKTAIFSI